MFPAIIRKLFCNRDIMSHLQLLHQSALCFFSEHIRRKTCQNTEFWLVNEWGKKYWLIFFKLTCPVVPNGQVMMKSLQWITLLHSNDEMTTMKWRGSISFYISLNGMLENINTKKAVDIEASQITMNWSLERYLLISHQFSRSSD